MTETTVLTDRGLELLCDPQGRSSEVVRDCLGALVAGNVRRNRVIAAKKEIEIHFEMDPELPALRLVAAKMEQVLDNLKGAGLGQSIVKNIVVRHGGDIRVESEPGQGATFQVCLPIGGVP